MPANIRAEMARRGLTQEATGAAIGLTQHAMSRRLRGEVEFSAGEVQRLGEFFEVAVATLYGESVRAVINVDGPPEEWAGQVAALMVARDRTKEQLARFFGAVFYRRRRA